MAITKINTPELFDLGATNSSLQLPSGNTASRPSNPSTGEWRYNTDDNKVEYWDGADWFQIDYEAPALTPTSNFQTVTYIGNGSTQIIDSKFDMASAFNASSSKVQINTTAFNLQNMSVSMWINPSLSQNPAEVWSQRYYTSPYERGWMLRIYSSGLVKIQYTTNNSGYVDVDSSTNISANQWSHIVVVFDRANTSVKLYLNGSLSTSATMNADISYTQGGITVPGASIGAGYTGYQYLGGKIDQVRVFNTALNLTQVGELYNDETDSTASVLNFPTGAGCIAAYQFNGNPADVGGTYGGVATDIGYTGLEFEPDFVWIKSRSDATNNVLVDSVRGVNGLYGRIYSNTTNAENTTSSDTVTSIGSNGFTVNSAGAGSYVNDNSSNYVAWCWKAASSDSTNTDGTITSTVRANQAAGFSIVSYTGEDAVRTIGHGLSSATEMMIIKNLTDGTRDWAVYHKDIGNTDVLRFNQTDAASSSSVFWNNTSPTSTLFTVGNSSITGSSDDFIAYCFHSVDGYQKVGSYTGNGSASGPIVETGFEPAFVLVKCTNLSSAGSYWSIFDNRRNPINPRDIVLRPNSASADWSADDNEIDFLSNGFQLKGTYDATNGNGNTYIYLAIAANPNPEPVLANSFDISLYTGNGGTQKVYSSLSPDLIWFKNRDQTDTHRLHDSIRGIGKYVSSDNTAAEVTISSGGPQSFDSNGFTTSSGGAYNATNEDYVAWQWKAAGIPTIDNDGSVTSLINANPNAGFSIVRWTGTGGINTIGHGLSAAPELILIKPLDVSSNWQVYAEPIGNNNKLVLDSSDAASSSTRFDSTSPTSSVFTFRDVGISGAFIAYCFHSVSGYQELGSFVGDGSTDTVLNLGFEPIWIMIKNTDTTTGWFIMDVERSNFSLRLKADTSNGDSSIGTLTTSSTGITISATNSDGRINGRPGYSDTMLYLAIG